jgi:eukaryotic-like serine/threonine-protein kinase
VPPGYLVFSREGSLWAAPFDLARNTIVGTAAPLAEDIEHTDNPVLHFDIAPDGSIVYLPAGEIERDVQRLVWIDRSGVETPVDLEPRPLSRVALSPDGTRIALAIRERGNTDVWLADVARRTMSRLTFEPTIETMPTWSPDGRTVAFRSERERPGIFVRDADGAGPIERLTETDGPIHSPYSWTPDGRTLLLVLFHSFRHRTIASVTPPDRTVRVLLDGNFAQLDPQVAPDGRWLAYQSDESGRFEVYVRPYPEVQTGRWQISSAGGTSPRWSADGAGLFYLNGSQLMSVRIRTSPAFEADAPRRLFEVTALAEGLGAAFAVSPDGRRFLFIVDTPAAAPRSVQLVVVQHWIEELRRQVAATR